MLLIAIILFIFLIFIGKYIEPFDSYKCKKQVDCPDDKYCDISHNNICIKKLEINNTCTNNYECKYGICDNNTSRCSLIKTGEKCNTNLDCDSGICDGSLHCL